MPLVCEANFSSSTSTNEFQFTVSPFNETYKVRFELLTLK